MSESLFMPESPEIKTALSWEKFNNQWDLHPLKEYELFVYNSQCEPETEIKVVGNIQTYLTVTLNNTTQLYFPDDLRDVYEAIEDSKIILTNEYAQGMDIEAADTDLYESAISFIYHYATHILRNSNREKKILKAPYIGLLPDNEISLEWSTEKADFLIIFKRQTDKAYFFGLNKLDGIPFKSGITYNKSVEPFIAAWLRDNLT